MQTKEKYYLGLDVGTASVGYAVTDENYNILTFRGKRMIGTRLFEEAKTAQERRAFRANRNRLIRLKKRLNILQEIFDLEISKVDQGFYQRLEESKLYDGDKTVLGFYSLFNDKNYTDKDFHKKYPTIYHLRHALISKPNEKFDIREIYLACHHILKNRGHFLNDNLEYNCGNKISLFDDIQTVFNSEFLLNKEDSRELRNEEINKIIEIISEHNSSTSERLRKCKETLNLNKVEEVVLRLLLGLNISSANTITLFGEQEDGKWEVGKMSTYADTGRDKILENLSEKEDIDFLDLAFKGYNSFLLSKLLPEGKSLSEAKVDSYIKHKKDLRLLKSILNEIQAKNVSNENQKKRDPYKERILNSDILEISYVNYIRKSKKGKTASQEKFYDFLKKELGKLQNDNNYDLSNEIREKINKVLCEIELEEFLPLQKTKENSAIPHQIHLAELKAILENQSKYYPFLVKKDQEYALTNKEKIEKLLKFRIPYYVGHINNAHTDEDGTGTAWVVRKARGQLLPWNFNELVDEEKSAEKFITNMTSMCTYLYGEKVLPKDSITYSRFAFLNEINNIKIDGITISEKARQDLIKAYENPNFKANPPKTIKQLKEFFYELGHYKKTSEITGIDKDIKSNLQSYRDMKSILDVYKYALAEDIIKCITLLGNDQKMLEKKLKNIFHEHKVKYTDEQLNKLKKLKYKDWGRLSEKFLIGIHGYKISEDGEYVTILSAMEKEPLNLNEVISKYQFEKTIDDENKHISANPKKFIEDSYASPSVKRALYQALSIVDEIVKAKGYNPSKMFIESIRSNQAPKGDKGRKDSRKEQLKALYKSIAESEIGLLTPNDKKTLNDQLTNELRLQQKKIFLYYLQLGKCMYSGDHIDLDNLLNSNSDYDIDHIFPKSKRWDNSFDNLVLTKKTENSKKKDEYPISSEVQNKMRSFWKILKDKNLISTEKYQRLTRTTPFTSDEISTFINRQLVETSQSTKLLKDLLNVHFNEDQNVKIYFTKAENVSNFRQEFGYLDLDNPNKRKLENLLKVRELNDLHHAYDAYLNIIVGNVWHTKYTKNYIFANYKNYNLKNLFNSNLENAWDINKSFDIIDKELGNSKVLVTKQAYENKGGFWNQQLSKKIDTKEGDYAPIKEGLPVTKYGGYPKISISFFSVYEYSYEDKQKKKQTKRSIVPIPRHLYIHHNPTLLKQYIIDTLSSYLGKKDNLIASSIKCIYEKICNGTLIKLNGAYYYTGGKTNNYMAISSAVQLRLGKQMEQYFDLLIKYKKNIEEKRDPSNNPHYNQVNFSNNLLFYDKLVNKGKTPIFKKQLKNKCDELEQPNVKNWFKKLTIVEQVDTLLVITNWLSNKIVTLKSLKTITNSRASFPLSLAGINELLIINQSPAGLYSNATKII